MSSPTFLGPRLFSAKLKRVPRTSRLYMGQSWASPAMVGGLGGAWAAQGN